MRTPDQRHAPPADVKSRLRNDFKPGEFTAAIETSGYRVLWEQASRCPCSGNDQTGQPHLNCPVCRRTPGWEYHGGVEIRAIVDGLGRTDQLLATYGERLTGLARVTVRPEHRPSFFHRYTLLDSVMEFSELLTRAEAGPDRPTYPIASTRMRLVVDGELRNLELRVLRLRRMDPASRLPGPLCRLDEDFRITPDGGLDWLPGDARGTAPKPGEAYALTYYCNPRYVVVDLPNAVRDTMVGFKLPDPVHVPLPVETLVRLDYLAREG